VKLSISAQQRAKAFIQSHARPLEQSLYSFHFEHTSRENVLHALASFQNSDGGFGHGKEPDLPLPASSAISTTRALQTLAEVGAAVDHPLVSGGLHFLLDTYDPKTQVWEIVPPSVNDWPHAPWWHYDADGQPGKWGGYLVNPRAEVIGCLYSFADGVPKPFLQAITEAMLAHLEGQPTPKDMHEIACYLSLLETPALPSEVRKQLLAKLEPAVMATVQRNPAKWDQYCFKPAGYMGAVRSPASPFAAMFAKEIDLCLDNEINRQHADGSWMPTWSWGQSFPEAWAKAKLAWQGILTVQTLKLLAAFGRLDV